MVKAASLSEILGGALDGQPARHSGGLGVWYETKTATPLKGEETDFLAIAPLPQSAIPATKDSIIPHLSQVVLSMPTASLKDLSEEKNGLPIRHGLTRAHPRVRMLTTHRDAHLYIFPRWTVDFINENSRLETIGEDVLGWWAKAGWQAGLPEKLMLDRILKKQDEHPDQSFILERETSPREGDVGAEESTGPVTGASRLTGDPHDATSPSQKGQTDVPPILAYIHPSDSSAAIIRRVDTSALLLAMSLQLAKLPSVEVAGDSASAFAHPRKVAYPEGVKPRTTITKQDSLIGENVTVEDKTSIKETVVGSNCQINEGAKLHQCLLMDGVTVGKACKLTRCILGKRCVIEDGCVLTDCEVQEDLVVQSKSLLAYFDSAWTKC